LIKRDILGGNLKKLETFRVFRRLKGVGKNLGRRNKEDFE